MRARTRNPFLTVRTEGSILPIDVLTRVIERDKDLDGLAPESYHLAKNERINEVATRAWNRLQGAWEAFREASERLSESDLGTSLTRERWLLILFQELGYGRLMTHRAWEIEDRTYPISHLWGSTPIHLVGCRVSMDKKQAGVAGAARVSPHSLVQEFLNRSDDHLWGIVSNGLILRLLRDNVSLTRQAFVEFDLEAMMEGEAFSDFVLLFMLCHQSRVEVPEDKTPDSCWLEQWHNAAAEQGIRALDELRSGVKNALDTLGAGFLAHPANTALRQKLKDGALSTQDYYRQLLRVVYRLLFLFVAEDRELLYDPDAPIANRMVYASYYSTHRIRELAQRRRGTKHADLYRTLRLVFDKLREGCPELALPALGSFLFSGESTPDLDAADLANRDLLAAFRQLACTIDGDALRPIDYRNLGPEELGSVYESLLEMHPQVNTDAATFKLDVAAGSERKTTGSYYTHSSLVQCLLDSALDPVLDEAATKSDPEAALLDLKICDPASGSGHFLIAAAHRVAKRLAAVRTGEDEPSPQATRAALRDVIGRCMYGVDVNPMAVELCKISLWMEAMEPGKTLGFLDHHIKCGNSLLGTTPALMAEGIPNDAFKPIEGDDKTVCKDLEAQNKGERAGLDMFSTFTERKPRADLTDPFKQLVDEDDASPLARKRKAEHYRALVQSADYVNAWFLADAWCAAFVLSKTDLEDLAVTHRRFRNWEANPETAKSEDREAVHAIADQYQFFHWHLAFPEVFRVPADGERPESQRCGWSGGFDCVLGNPPWDRVKFQEREYFAHRDPAIAQCSTASRRHAMIASLATSNPGLFSAYRQAKRHSEATGLVARESGYYPYCGRGDINTYALFAELKMALLGIRGYTGFIAPSALATGDTTKYFFQFVVDEHHLVTLFDFENRKKIFPEVQGNVRFSLFTFTSGEVAGFKVGAQLDDPALLNDKARVYALSTEDVARANPNTRTCPAFRTARDAQLVLALHSQPVLVNEQIEDGNRWSIRFETQFHMTNNSNLFLTIDDVETQPAQMESPGLEAVDVLPLYEAKLIGQFDHRAGTFAGISSDVMYKMHAGTKQLTPTERTDPCCRIAPRYWIRGKDVPEKARESGWIACFRNAISSVADSRSFVSVILPTCGVGNSLICLETNEGPRATLFMVSLFNSFTLDYVLRQKATGGNASYFIVKQLPVPTPEAARTAPRWCAVPLIDWIAARTLELSAVTWDLSAVTPACNYGDIPPFVWDEGRRFLLRCELDAAFFHLYLGMPREWDKQGSKQLLEYFPTPRDAVEYIMETFPIVKRKDEEQYGEYRTKLQILDIYDRMQHAMDTGEPYQSLLDPPPGPPADEHGNFLPLPEWKPGHRKPPTWPPHIHPPKDVTEYEAN
jgi:hypothetical protein